MDSVLKVADQVYKFVFAGHRMIAEIIAIFIVVLLLHCSLNVLAGRAKLPPEIAPETPSVKTSGDGSPVVVNPSGPVSINPEIKK